MHTEDNLTDQLDCIIEADPKGDAQMIVRGQVGSWCKRHEGGWRSYGTAACPVCQPERLPDQRALSVEYRVGRVPLFCTGAGCEVTDIVKALRASGAFTGYSRVGLPHSGVRPCR